MRYTECVSESTADLKVELLFQGLIPYIRKCQTVVAVKSAALSPICETRFGGTPYMEEGDSWPVCTGCRSNLDFVCQLRLPDHLPDMPRRVALLTLYYCQSCAPEEGWAQPKEGPLVIRLYEEPAEPLAIQPTLPDTSVAASVECRDAICLPSWMDLPEDLRTLARDANTVDPSAAYDYLVEAVDAKKHGGSRVGGYPGWLSARESLSCARCKAALAFMAQLDHEPALGLNWAKSGRMYLFFCREHSGQMAFRIQSGQ
jgi:hypothetical protein